MRGDARYSRGRDVLGLVWGIAGVFLAVPLLAMLRIVMERDEWFAPVAAFLAD